MKKISKYQFKLLELVIVLIFFIFILSSCELLDFGKKQAVKAPKIHPDTLFSIEKILPDYYNGKTGKNEIYNDPESVMAVESGEALLITINYENKNNLSFNKVVIEGGKASTEILAKNFEEGSDSNHTIIKFFVDEVDSPTNKTYTIAKIFYNVGSSVISMGLKEEEMQFFVNIDPVFTITLDYQNEDIRTNTEKTVEEVEVSYYQTLNKIIPDVSYRNQSQDAPIKEGGWVFRGYFTKPKGEGIEVSNEEKYYFWNDITLYAYFERLFTFSISNAEEPIVDGDTTYYKVATVLRKTVAGDLQQDLEIYDTIADDDGVYPIVAIDDDAFENTRSLENLKIGKFVKSIGKDAFSSSNVEYIEFAEGSQLEKIDNRAFFGTTYLGTNSKGFTLPRTVKYLGERCFASSGWGKTIPYDKTKAESTLIIYNNITHIGNWCFSNTKFEKVEFESGVKFKVDAVDGENYIINGEEQASDYYLGFCLFKNCENLSRFITNSTDSETADGLEYIAPGMFDIFYYNQDSDVGLVYVKLAEGLKKIGKDAFHYQKNLESIEFPDSLEDICSDNNIKGKQFFDDTKDEKSEYGSFAECHSLSSITFGENSKLQVIGCRAFFNNWALEAIDIPSKDFAYYGVAVFQGCDNLMRINFGFDGTNTNNESIIPQPIVYPKGLGVFGSRGDYADLFYPTMSFKVFVTEQVIDGFKNSLLIGSKQPIDKLQVYASEMIKTIKDGTGNDIDIALGEVTIDQIHGYSIGCCFANSGIIDLPDTVEINGEELRILQISPYAFTDGVEEVILPYYLSEISNCAFYNCATLTTLHYGHEKDEFDNYLDTGIQQLTKIGERAFCESGLKTFIGGSNLKSIDHNAFWGSDIEVIDLKRCTKMYGEKAQPKQNTDDDLLSGYMSINSGIGVGAFDYCRSLRYVRLPNTLNIINDSTFAHCSSLKTLVFENEIPNENLFPNSNATYFQGVSSGIIKSYVRTQSAYQAYSELENLPNAIEGNFVIAYDDMPEPFE